MKNIGALAFKEGNQPHNRFAVVELNTDYDDSFKITINGTDQNGQQVFPRFVQIDNFNNIGAATVTINEINVSVGAYTRVTLNISPALNFLDVFAVEGKVKLYFSENQLGIGDGQNDLQAQNAFNMATYLKRDGSEAMLASYSMGNFSIADVANPTADQDAANKRYVKSRTRNAFTPEYYGASGNSSIVTGNNSLDGPWFEAMMVDARLVANAEINCGSNKVYTIDNPFLWGGDMKTLVVNGNGSTIMNSKTGAALTTFDANYTPWGPPNFTNVNGVTPLTFAGIQVALAATYTGIAAATVNINDNSVTSRDGVTALRTGKCLIYSQFRFNDNGSPPCASVFEYNNITTLSGGSNQTGTLRQSTTKFQDSLAPDREEATLVGLYYGSVKVWPLNRPVGNYEKHNELDYMEVNDLTFVRNPGLTAAVADYVGNTAYCTGAQKIVWNRINGKNAAISCAKKVIWNECNFYGEVEIDKLVEEVWLFNCDIYSLIGGTSCKKIYVVGGKIINNWSLCPIEYLGIDEVTSTAVDSFSVRAAFGIYAFGCGNVTINNLFVGVNNSLTDRFLELLKYSAVITVVAPDEIKMTRAIYISSEFWKMQQVGSILYNAKNIPIAKITRAAHCPSVNRLTGDVHFKVRMLGSGLITGDTVRLTAHPNVNINGVNYSGPYMENMSATFSNENAAPLDNLAVIKDNWMQPEGIVINSKLTVYSRAGNTYCLRPGRLISIYKVIIDVITPAVSGGAVTMIVNGEDLNAIGFNICLSIDLKTTGRRELDKNGFTTLGADSATSVIPANPLSILRIIDASRALTQDNQAEYVIKFLGNYVEGI